MQKPEEKKDVSTPDPYYVLFQHQGTHEHLKNPLGKHSHNACIQRNPQYVAQKQFVLLCTRPTEPFQEHQLGMHVHIVYTQYKNRKFLLNVT